MAKKKKIEMKVANTGRRCIVVFGPPCSGVSTLIDVLKNSAETPIASVPYVGPGSIPAIEEALGSAEVVFVDVDGGLFTPEDVQLLNDSRIVSTGNGAIIRVGADDEDCLSRSLPRGNKYITKSDLREWSRGVGAIEQTIHQHSIPYFMIGNHDLEHGVVQLALRSSITR